MKRIGHAFLLLLLAIGTNDEIFLVGDSGRFCHVLIAERDPHVEFAALLNFLQFHVRIGVLVDHLSD